MWSRLGGGREKWKQGERCVESSQQRGSKRSKVTEAEEAWKMGAHSHLFLSQRPVYLLPMAGLFPEGMRHDGQSKSEGPFSEQWTQI